MTKTCIKCGGMFSNGVCLECGFSFTEEPKREIDAEQIAEMRFGA